MKILCVFGQHNYGDPDRGLSYEYANFIPALNCLKHEVTHFESWDRSKYRDFAELNRAFIETLEHVQPDVVFCVLMQYEIWLDVLEETRKRCPAALIHWGTDDTWKYDQSSRWVAPPFHVHATTAHDALRKGGRDGLTNIVLSQWAANSATLAEPQSALRCRYAVSFVGSAYGNRLRLVADLKAKGIEVACFGHGWSSGAVRADEIPRILRNSVVSLNFGDSGLQLGKWGLYRSRQIKARVFEVPGSGGCLLTESAPDLADYYEPGKEILVFEGIDDLAGKIEHILSHPKQRDAIAWAGYERTRREHTYEHRFERLLTLAVSRRGAAGVDGEKTCRFDRDWFAGLRSVHKLGGILRALRAALIAVLSFGFGSTRGPRAARRVTYEISWRLFGARTFRATGLPGRMFYRES